MSKEECLEILLLLQQLDAWNYSHDISVPDWIMDNLENAIYRLKEEVLDSR
jgi:hypothetical protein